MLSRIQEELEAIYRLEVPHRVEDFLVGREAYRRMRPDAAVPEELLVVEEEDEALVALWLDDELLDRIRDLDLDHPDPDVLGEALADFTTALEGVSHFLYLVHRAGSDRPVSLLELELQAEVDKFVHGLLHLWRRGGKTASPELRRRLFEAVGYRDDLDESAHDRYRLANGVAARYCRRLEARYLGDGTPEGLLREVREFYRCGASEKVSRGTLH